MKIQINAIALKASTLSLAIGLSLGMLASLTPISASANSRAEQCSELRQEIKRHEAMLKYAVEQDKQQVIPVLIEVLLNLKATFEKNCVMEV